MCNNAIGYSIDSTTQSNAELLQRACEFYGVDKTKVHAGIISVCTNTTQEYAFYYFMYQYNGINYKAEISKTSIEITAINAWGTVALTGGTTPYHIGVLFFNK